MHSIPAFRPGPEPLNPGTKRSGSKESIVSEDISDTLWSLYLLYENMAVMEKLGNSILKIPALSRPCFSKVSPIY
jgi:hypothetical protein